jgi:hypothetical protein
MWDPQGRRNVHGSAVDAPLLLEPFGPSRVLVLYEGPQYLRNLIPDTRNELWLTYAA